MELKSIIDEQGRLRSTASKIRGEYLQEVMQIQHELGDLNQIRINLGLSQRQICKLLLVDPSAWTRWNKTGAPPHIYQALKWLVELRKVKPDAIFTSNLENKMDFIQTDTRSKIEQLEMGLEKVQHALSMSVSHVSVLNQENRLQKEIDSLKNVLAKLSEKKAARTAKPSKAKRSARKLLKKKAKKTLKPKATSKKKVVAKKKKDFRRKAR